MKVRIKRQEGPQAEPYWQTFIYEKTGKDTVAAILDHLNYRDDLIDEEGKLCRRIRWECSCMQKMCGACAMVINRMPGLACDTFVDCSDDAVLTLEPLTKFPVICDLCVDRSCIQEYLKEAGAYQGARAEGEPSEFQYQYQVAKCLKCGLCLEVCPNYVGPKGNFFGAILANESYLVHSQSADRKKLIKKEYRKHFERGCSRSLACRDICPMKMPTLSSIGYMNKLF